MRIVINIPEELYKKVSLNNPSYGEDFPLYYAVRNGKPLPKGHGRLIDEKDLSLMTIHMIDGTLVCDAPTIIEADKEDEQKV